ncbi:hypothetical protein BU26DRAFT_212738 [Trematosphaeria pertusa]|uniref:Uncharacterized protein n=1 Tax=Trematosphaeria pertusa TaxID=390896 RepID=A0A6A6ISA1_9PLEO|nr:uncharacterized protein BU26DRAFT_212738 [Trematosphaeria pertusa]KAF2252997.1 hypothetical protein BU26DRAFT_212738 [Trematosphaeria pertusa]
MRPGSAHKQRLWRPTSAGVVQTRDGTVIGGRAVGQARWCRVIGRGLKDADWPASEGAGPPFIIIRLRRRLFQGCRPIAPTLGSRRPSGRPSHRAPGAHIIHRASAIRPATVCPGCVRSAVFQVSTQRRVRRRGRVARGREGIRRAPSTPRAR